MKAEIQKAKWTGMFGMTKRRQERAPAVEPVLRKLSVGRQMVRMEIDSAMAQFNTGLLVKNEMVLVGKPEGLEASMRRGDIVRFRIPWEQKFEVRMKIYVLHLNLSNGTEAFLCQKPSGSAHPAQRINERFNTRRFSNIRLDLPALKDSFSILDLSVGGCRVNAEPKFMRNAFKVNQRLWEGIITVGERFQVRLDLVIPRAYHDGTVGLEFKVNRGERYGQHLTTILGTLAMREGGPFGLLATSRAGR